MADYATGNTVATSNTGATGGTVAEQVLRDVPMKPRANQLSLLHEELDREAHLLEELQVKTHLVRESDSSSVSSDKRKEPGENYHLSNAVIKQRNMNDFLADLINELVI